MPLNPVMDTFLIIISYVLEPVTIVYYAARFHLHQLFAALFGQYFHLFSGPIPLFDLARDTEYNDGIVNPPWIFPPNIPAGLVHLGRRLVTYRPSDPAVMGDLGIEGYAFYYLRPRVENSRWPPLENPQLLQAIPDPYGGGQMVWVCASCYAFYAERGMAMGIREAGDYNPRIRVNNHLQERQMTLRFGTRGTTMVDWDFRPLFLPGVRQINRVLHVLVTNEL
jgi:hypothetical protein